MNIENVWLIILALSTPIAGVVGFSIQLRNVKKGRLENEKLELEISRLKEAAERDKTTVRVANDEEIKKYVLDSPKILLRSQTQKYRNGAPRFDFDWQTIGLLSIAAVLILYFIFDVYRLGAWLVSMF